MKYIAEYLQNNDIEKIREIHHLVEFGRISSGLFHDLMSPLSALSVHLSSLAKESGCLAFAEAREEVEKLSRMSIKMSEFIAQARSLLRRPDAATDAPILFSMIEEIRTVAAFLGTKASQSRVDLHIRAAKDIRCDGHPAIFRHIITNLVANAIESYPAIDVMTGASRRRVLIKLSSKKGEARISVADRGCGIPDDIRSSIFDLFFTSKSASGANCGIGLASVRSSLEQHFGGKIRLRSRPGKGSEFEILIPLKARSVPCGRQN